MISKRCLTFALALALPVSASVLSAADDWITTSGRTFRQAEVVKFDGDAVTLKHAGGSDRVALTEFPEAVRKLIGAEARNLELRRKAEEVERLKEELSRAQSELKQLKTDNEQLRKEKSEAVQTAAKATAAVEKVTPKPSRPIQEVAAITPQETIEARDLALYFANDPAAAAQRFSGQRFRVRGTIESFEPKMLRQRFDVLLATADKTQKVVCAFAYPDGTRSMFTTKRGQVLVRVPERGGEIPYLEVGKELVVEGRCDGTADGEVRFRALRIAQ
jgi:hypothetical protein